MAALNFHTKFHAPQVSELCDIEEDEYAPYPPAFSPSTPGRIQSQTLPLHLNDPFNLSNLSNLSDNISYYDAVSHFDDMMMPPPASEPTLSCSVCGLSNGALALLDPCAHPLCSACLTSALNIVGEKDMQCAVCNMKVDDFKLQNYKGVSGRPEMEKPGNAYNDSFTFAPGILEDSFEDFIDRAQGASTPVAGTRSSRKSMKPDERVVLRIDNVPWVCPIIVSIVYSLSSHFKSGYHPSRYHSVAQAPCCSRARFARS